MQVVLGLCVLDDGWEIDRISGNVVYGKFQGKETKVGVPLYAIQGNVFSLEKKISKDVKDVLVASLDEHVNQVDITQDVAEVVKSGSVFENGDRIVIERN